MVYNYVYSIPRSHFLPPFLCPSLVVCDGWLPEWRWKAKLACFRQGSCCVWCQIMCTEESEESVIKAKPPIIMSDSTVVLNPPQLVERDFFFLLWWVKQEEEKREWGKKVKRSRGLFWSGSSHYCCALCCPCQFRKSCCWLPGALGMLGCKCSAKWLLGDIWSHKGWR